MQIDSPGKLLNKRQHHGEINNLKFTPKKKRIFLESLAKRYNFSLAAQKAGINRQNIKYHIENDPVFKQAIDTIKNAYLDTVEESGFTVALQPTREGFNDRKLMLQSHRKEVYAPTVQVDIDQQITIHHAPSTLRGMISKALKEDSEEVQYSEK